MDTYIAPSRSAHKRMAQRFATDAADGLKTEANAALVEAISLVRALRDAGARSLSVGAVKNALIDAFGDIQGGINRVLDNEGLVEDGYQIDISELEGM